MTQLDQYIHQRQPTWEEMERLLRRAQRGGLSRLSAEEVYALGRLYRQVSSDLAIAQRDFPHQQVAAYLNQLVARAHPLVYQTGGLGFGRLLAFITAGFPRLFRQTAAFTLAATLIFLGAALLAVIAVNLDETTAEYILPGTAHRLIDDIHRGELWMNQDTGATYMSSMIMRNNIQVAFFAFAGGVLVGLGTVYVLAFNGLIFGTLATLIHRYHLAGPFWAFVLPHGVIELSVIFIAGGAGMQLGYAILRPGLLTRRDALVLAGRRAVRLLFGVALLLVIAGTIEGFISPSPDFPPAFKYAFGLCTGAALYSYLGLAGRPRRAQRRPGAAHSPLP